MEPTTKPTEPKARAFRCVPLNRSEFAPLAARYDLPAPSKLSPLPDLTAATGGRAPRPLHEIVRPMENAADAAVRWGLTPLAQADRVVDVRIALFEAVPTLCRLYASRKEEGIFAGLRHGTELEREVLFPFTVEDLTSWLFGQMQFSVGSALPAPAKEISGTRLAVLLNLADAFKAAYVRSFERSEKRPPVSVSARSIFEAQEQSRSKADRRWIARSVDEHLRAMLHPGGSTQVGLPALDRETIDRELRGMEAEGLLTRPAAGKDPIFFPQGAAKLWGADLVTWIATISMHDIQVLGGTDDAYEAEEEALWYVITPNTIWTFVSVGLGQCSGDVGAARFGMMSGGMVNALDVARRFLTPAPEARVPESFYDAGSKAAPEKPKDAFCGQCGQPLRPGVRFCTVCGSAV